MLKSIRLNKFFYYFLLAILLTPIFAYFVLAHNQTSIYYYYKIIAVLSGVVFVFIYKPKWQPYHFFILCFTIYLIIWSFFNGDFYEKGFMTYYNLTNLGILFSTLILSNLSYSDLFIQRSIKIMKLFIILAFLATITQIINPSFLDANYLWDPVSLGDIRLGDLYLDRRTSIFGYIEPNSYGLDFIPLLFLVIAFILFEKRKFLFAYLLMGGMISLLSNTRYIMIAFIIGLIMIPIYRKITATGAIKNIFLMVILSFSLFYIMSYFGYDFSDWYETRLFPEGSIQETTRYKAMENFALMFSGNEIFGIGSETNDYLLTLSHQVGSSRIHVGYFGYMIAWGIFGSFLLFGSWFLIIRRFYLNARNSGYWGSFFGFLSFLWANVTFPQFSIFYYGLLFTFIFDKYYYDKSLLIKSYKQANIAYQ